MNEALKNEENIVNIEDYQDDEVFALEPADEGSSDVVSKLVILGVGAGIGVAGKCAFDWVRGVKYTADQDLKMVSEGLMSDEDYLNRHRILGKANLRKLDRSEAVQFDSAKENA